MYKLQDYMACVIIVKRIRQGTHDSFLCLPKLQIGFSELLCESLTLQDHIFKLG